MTAIDANDTLADLVTARPTMAVRLDRLGLDYCCGGQRRLADAVTEAGLDLDDVIDALLPAGAAPETVDWAAMVPAELVDHLEANHHAYLRDALPRLVVRWSTR